MGLVRADMEELGRTLEILRPAYEKSLWDDQKALVDITSGTPLTEA